MHFLNWTFPSVTPSFFLLSFFFQGRFPHCSSSEEFGMRGDRPVSLRSFWSSHRKYIVLFKLSFTVNTWECDWSQYEAQSVTITHPTFYAPRSIHCCYLWPCLPSIVDFFQPWGIYIIPNSKRLSGSHRVVQSLTHAPYVNCSALKIQHLQGVVVRGKSTVLTGHV